MSRRRTLLAIAVPAIAATFPACAEASGEIRGGGGELDTRPAPFVTAKEPDLLWRALFSDYFGRTGQARCARTDCHGAPGTEAARIGIECFDEDGCRASILEKGWIRLPMDANEPEKSGFYNILRHRAPDDGHTIGTMPKEPGDFFFDQAALDRVAAWIRTVKAE